MVAEAANFSTSFSVCLFLFLILYTLIIFFRTQRDDLEVLDEPLYGTFLHVTGVERPYREDVLSKMVCHISLTDVLPAFIHFIKTLSFWVNSVMLSLNLCIKIPWICWLWLCSTDQISLKVTSLNNFIDYGTKG